MVPDDSTARQRALLLQQGFRETIGARRRESVIDSLTELHASLHSQVEASQANASILEESSSKIAQVSGMYQKMEDTVRIAGRIFRRIRRSKHLYRWLFYAALVFYIVVCAFVILKRIFPWKLIWRIISSFLAYFGNRTETVHIRPH